MSLRTRPNIYSEQLAQLRFNDRPNPLDVKGFGISYGGCAECGGKCCNNMGGCRLCKDRLRKTKVHTTGGKIENRNIMNQRQNFLRNFIATNLDYRY